MPFLLTADPGLEDVVVEELREGVPGVDAQSEPDAEPGRVRVEGAKADDLLELRTIHHVIAVRAEARADSLDEIRDLISGAPFDEMAGVRSFRVSSVCTGRTDFDRMALQRAAGAVLHRRFGTPVDLEGFELNVRVDAYGPRIVAGIQLTRESLDRRLRRGKVLRSSLKPTLAAALVRLAGAHRGTGCLIDPMCGAGVIPVEAAAINRALEIHAADWDEPTVEAANGTFANHGLPLAARVADARSLGDECPERFDFVVTDPPYGLRQARRAALGALYRDLLASFEKALRPGGRLAIVVVKHRVFRAALERTGLRIARERLTRSGDVPFTIFVLAHGDRAPATASRR